MATSFESSIGAGHETIKDFLLKLTSARSCFVVLLSGLRGAAALKLRAADLRGIGNNSSNAMAMSISAGIQKGTTLRVCLPCGE
jgi:hypothetical protein